MRTPLTMARTSWRGITGAVSTLIIGATLVTGLGLGVTGPTTSPVAPLATPPVPAVTPAQSPDGGDRRGGGGRGDGGRDGGGRG